MGLRPTLLSVALGCAKKNQWVCNAPAEAIRRETFMTCLPRASRKFPTCSENWRVCLKRMRSATMGQHRPEAHLPYAYVCMYVCIYIYIYTHTYMRMHHINI